MIIHHHGKINLNNYVEIERTEDLGTREPNLVLCYSAQTRIFLELTSDMEAREFLT